MNTNTMKLTGIQVAELLGEKVLAGMDMVDAIREIYPENLISGFKLDDPNFWVDTLKAVIEGRTRLMARLQLVSEETSPVIITTVSPLYSKVDIDKPEVPEFTRKWVVREELYDSEGVKLDEIFRETGDMEEIASMCGGNSILDNVTFSQIKEAKVSNISIGETETLAMFTTIEMTQDEIHALLLSKFTL